MSSSVTELFARGALHEEGELIATRESLLSRLCQHENDGWREFFETYWKLIYNTARRYGCTDSEAQEVVQETMIGVSDNIPTFRYEPERCAFKTWLMNLTRWRITDQLRKRHTHAELEAAANVPEEEKFTKLWEEDWEHNLINAALERVKVRVNPKDYQIFAFCILQHKGTADTARVLNVNRARIYLARHRISREFYKEITLLRQTTGG